MLLVSMLPNALAHELSGNVPTWLKGKNMKRLGLFIISVMLVFTLTACDPAEKPPAEGASVNGTLDKGEAGERWWFTIETKDQDKAVGIDFRGTVIRGNVRAQLHDAEGRVMWTQEADPGPFAANTVVNLPQHGIYELGLAWDGAVLAQYSLKWQPGEVKIAALSPLALLGGAGMVLVAAAFIAYAAWNKLGWGYLGLGALAWVVTVALKFAWAIPTNTPVSNALSGSLPEWLTGPIFWLYLGALTGVFEVALTWLLLRYTRLGRTTWARALAFGIGFGAVEALLLGLLSLGSVLTAVLAPAVIPYEGLAALARLNNPLFGLAPVIERIAVVFAHIFSNLLLFYGVQKKQPGWFWLAFAYKTVLDTFAAFAQFWGVDTVGRIWPIEAILIVFGVIGWQGILWLQPRYHRAALGRDECF